MGIMKKRILSLVIALVLAGGILSVPSYATEAEADPVVLPEDPFIAATTDAGDVLEIENMGTLDYDIDTVIPYYVVTIPESATRVDITFPEYAAPSCITDEESGLSAQGCYRKLEDDTIGGQINFKCEIVEDGYSVTMPLNIDVHDGAADEWSEVSFTGGEYVVAVEKNQENNNVPIAFFSFNMTAEFLEDEGGEAVCDHCEITIYCEHIVDTQTHTETEICNLCEEQLRDTYVADCIDKDCDGNCDDCEGALTIEDTVDIEALPSLPSKEVQPGDVNGDGTVNGRDLICLRKHLDGDPAQINAANADVDSNGSVDELDVDVLRKKLVE